ncbi:MAG: PIN domain-containing protein [Sphaerospermopsis kisseleviana]
MTFLCDTNIISELARPQPNAGVLIWLQNLSDINISVITVEEIYYGLTAKPNPKIQNWFDNFLKNNWGLLNKPKTLIYQRLEADKQKKSARVLKGIREKVCIFWDFERWKRNFQTSS